MHLDDLVYEDHRPKSRPPTTPNSKFLWDFWLRAWDTVDGKNEFNSYLIYSSSYECNLDLGSPRFINRETDYIKA